MKNLNNQNVSVVLTTFTKTLPNIITQERLCGPHVAAFLWHPPIYMLEAAMMLSPTNAELFVYMFVFYYVVVSYLMTQSLTN